MSTAGTTLLTAEQFAEQYADRHAELVDGVVEDLPLAQFPHGVVASRFGRYLGNFVEESDLGWVASNDTFVLTKRDPDRVRGGDIVYWSYQRVPKGQVTTGLITAPPELVAEVRSPSDRWKKVVAKVNEYLAAEVSVVVVFDPAVAAASIFRPDEFPQVFHNSDELVIPDLLPGFSVPLPRLFKDVAGQL